MRHLPLLCHPLAFSFEFGIAGHPEVSPDISSLAIESPHMAAQAPQPPPYDLVKLREIIARSAFADLRIFCADLGEDYDAIVGEGKTVPVAALDIVKFYDNRGRVAELVERVRKEFPSAEWEAVVRSGVIASVSATEAPDTVAASAKVGRVPGPLRIFICHASPDKARAHALYTQLKAAGAQPWLDEEDLMGGQDWRDVIHQAVEQSDVVLVCLSRQSVEHAGFVKDEIGFALTHAERQPKGSIFVVPLRLEACEVPERLKRWHWVDWFDARGSERLQRALQRRVTDVGALTLTALPTPDAVRLPVEPVLSSQPKPSETQPTPKPAAEDAQPKIAPGASPTETQPPPIKPVVSRRTLLIGLSGAAGLGAAAWIANRAYAPGSPPVTLPAQRVDPVIRASATLDPTMTVVNTPTSTTAPAKVVLSPNLSLLVLAPGVNLELVRVPAGPFLMGSDKTKDSQAYDAELPQHSLTLGDYYIGKYEVTNTQFLAFVQATGYKTTAEKEGAGADWRHPRGPDTNIDQKAQHPVVQVSWHDAIAFCDWLSKVSGRKVTLPSEPEWEKAARGVDGRIYPWGNDAPTKDLLNFNRNVGDTTPVGQYSPKGDSPYGVADMAGNAWEWTRSLWGKDVNTPEFKYPYVAGDGREDLNAGEDVRRVVRGGSWAFTIGSARCAVRLRDRPDVNISDLNGFRVVLVAAPV